MRKKIGKKKVSVEAQAPVEGLNLDLLLSTYKNNFTKDTPLEPLIVLSDDEDINDYMDNDDIDNKEPSQLITNVEEIDSKKAEPAVEEACVMDVADDDSVAMSSTEKESDGTAGSPILSLMMVLQQILKSCNIAMLKYSLHADFGWSGSRGGGIATAKCSGTGTTTPSSSASSATTTTRQAPKEEEEAAGDRHRPRQALLGQHRAGGGRRQQPENLPSEVK